MGGSFNPLHIGHCMLADTVAQELGYDRVLFVPAFIPPHKEMRGAVPAADRLAMIERFCADSRDGGGPRFFAEDCEIRRGGVSYTLDTLQYILGAYASELDGKPGLVMGQEVAAQFGKWHCAAEVAAAADLILARRHPDANRIAVAGFENRPAEGYADDFADGGLGCGFAWPHRMLENPVLPVSSTEIRARIAQGKSWRYLVPDAVFRYIRERHFYECAEGW